MNECNICPRKCNVDRTNTFGYCRMGHKPRVSKVMLHMWEEPCISGTKGSGAVFFSGCNLRCVFCQNYKISQEEVGGEADAHRLADIFLSLESKGAHNINLVNPTHFIPAIAAAIDISRQNGLKIPFIYNTNGYEAIESLKLLDGKIQVYLPDIKYMNSEASLKYSGASDYFTVCSEAVKEMYRQVGVPKFDQCGIIIKGLIIRHLILPSLSKDSLSILNFIAENFPKDIFVSIMSQYIPYYKADRFPKINRKLTKFEYDRVLEHFYSLGMDNGYMQERESASNDFIPEF